MKPKQPVPSTASKTCQPFDAMNFASTRKPRMKPVEEQRLADFGRIVFQQNWESARHLRNARAVSAHTFAAVIAACLTALQFVRTDRFFELVLLGFLVFVSVIQVLITVELTRELDDCTRKIDRQVESSGWADCVALLPRNSDVRGWLHLRWLYPIVSVRRIHLEQPVGAKDARVHLNS